MGIRSQNNPLAAYLDVFSNTGTDAAGAPPPTSSPAGIVASGGVVSDYEVSGTYYRTHIFNTTGTFDVTQLSSSPAPNDVEYLVVAGGGGGANYRSGGGGAGGLRTNLSGHPRAGATLTASVQSYPVTVGAGGAGGYPAGAKGGDSNFGPISSTGGGHATGAATGNAGDGGSGGGADWNNYSAEGGGNEGGYSPSEGNPGGNSANPNAQGGQGGGGGAGAPGSDGTTPTGGAGGIGLQVLISGPPASPQPMGTPGPGPSTGWFAGGGGGGADTGKTGGAGGAGGGGDATTPGTQNDGQANTGGGAGGAVFNPAIGGGGPNSPGGNGGSGTVIVRYQITSTQSGDPSSGGAKATGGTFYRYGSKTVHVFTASGDFTNTSGAPLTVDHILVAGGGGGGSGGGSGSGGGGAGGVRTSIPGIMTVADTQKTVGPGAPNKYTVTIGGGGAGSPNYTVASVKGTDTDFNGPDGNVNVDGGGRGGYYPPNANAEGGSGGSGGGAAGYASPNTPLSGGAASESGNQGTAGGNTPGAGNYAAAGGGGAGSIGGNSDGATAGHGGAGVQLPASIKNPAYLIGTPGPSGTHWFAGGGGGGGGENQTTYGRGGGPGGPYAGGGNGSTRTGSPTANLGGTYPGTVNTGGGGGGSNNTAGGDGGSGLVIITYDT